MLLLLRRAMARTQISWRIMRGWLVSLEKHYTCLGI